MITNEQIDSRLQYCIECLEKGYKLLDWWKTAGTHKVYFSTNKGNTWCDGDTCNGVHISFSPFYLTLSGTTLRYSGKLLLEIEVDQYMFTEEGFFSLNTLYDIPFTYKQFKEMGRIINVLSKRS